MRAGFEASYRHLDHDLARVFRLLTVNLGPDISTEVTAVITKLDTRVVGRALEELARAHMIERGNVYGRWRMHDLVRLYSEDHGRAYAGTGRPGAGVYPALERLSDYHPRCCALFRVTSP